MQPNPKGLHHDHIDGSMAVREIISDLYILAGKEFPFVSNEAWLTFFRDTSRPIPERFDTVTSVLQSRETLALLGLVYTRFRAEHGYDYFEGKFAPQYGMREGLSMREATGALVEGVRLAESQFLRQGRKVKCTPVICIGREAKPEIGIEIAKIALEYDGELVLDLVCDEAGNPPEKHLPAYKLTFGSNVKRDCHAGEWVDAEPKATYFERLTKNVRTALFDLKCHSIGHAIPLGQNPELVKYVVANDIRVTGCPLSNLRSGLIKDLRELRIDYLLDQGVIYTLNPDDDAFLPSMDEVLSECDAAYNFTSEQCRKLEKNVFRGAFGLASNRTYAPRKPL